MCVSYFSAPTNEIRGPRVVEESNEVILTETSGLLRLSRNFGEHFIYGFLKGENYKVKRGTF